MARPFYSLVRVGDYASNTRTLLQCLGNPLLADTPADLTSETKEYLHHVEYVQLFTARK